MWTMFVASLFSLLTCGGSVMAVEHWRVARADAAFRDGRAFEAYTLLVRLAASNPVFLDRRAIDLRREMAAHAAIAAAVREHQFERAQALARAIVSDPDSGFEADAIRSLATLPEQHLAFAEALLEAGDARAAVREARSMFGLYPEDATWTTPARYIEARGRVALVRTSLTNGDADGAVSLVASLGPDLPLPESAEVRRLFNEAILHAADAGERDGRFGSLYRFFDASRESISGHDALMTTLDDAFSSVTQRLFDIPFRPGGLRAVNAPPVPVSVGGADDVSDAVLWLRNDTARPLTIVLRGPERYGTTLPPRSRGRLDIASGEYVQVAYGGTDARPFVGVIALDGQREQIFAALN